MSEPARLAAFDPLTFARTVMRSEADAVRLAADRLGASFLRVVELLAGCRGRVAVTGVGKSADVGRKLVGTLNSTGTRAYALDATRAVHGDLGAVHPDDVALLLSHSGESEELLRLLDPLRELASAVVAMTGNAQSTLARSAAAAVVYGPIVEACPLSLAPSSSTTVMIALGDAIAFTLSEQRQFTAEQFARFHPAGSLGRKLAGVEAYMRSGPELRIAAATETVRAVFARSKQPGRRTGAVMLTHADGTLAGIFTDSDLARLFERNADGAFDRPIEEVMTRRPLTVTVGAKMGDALDLLRARKISELPVVDTAGKPVGLLDVTDLIGVELPGDDGPPTLKLVSS
ncbi:MAG: KpsF/GutQ family sugar-phosphate isomerase [Fimbriiglobus sp.]|nr:KpsF/GutQ family sugar-phosphate isomerase [Fimbriiglobus sp.]